jgi:hypothetical protein
VGASSPECVQRAPGRDRKVMLGIVMFCFGGAGRGYTMRNGRSISRHNSEEIVALLLPLLVGAVGGRAWRLRRLHTRPRAFLGRALSPRYMR